ncbi:MAG: M3 family metallopeptidase [Trueperaceae bacterium]|nr:M3 family metallopeptidase [Trueperaceae bacterium]
MAPLTWDALEPRLQELLDRPLAAPDVAAFLVDVDAIAREVWEAYAGLMRAKDEDTSDEAAAAAFLAFVQDVLPRLEPISDALNRKLLAVPEYAPPADLQPAWADLNDTVALYRETNVPLNAEEQGLRQRYGAIAGRTRVVLDGTEVTVAAARAKLEANERDLRERAWRAIEAGKEAQRADLDALFLEFVRLRARIAKNADLPDYRAYAWRERHRREYTPDDALAFHEAVASEVVPRLRARNERRRERMGVATLRPWDTAADPDGRPPLKPFTTAAELEAGLQRLFHALDPDLGSAFDLLVGGWMDLEPRANKVPGLGYQSYFPVSKRPYVYWSAVGTDDDLLTMRHEAGHAFHSVLTERAWPLVKHACQHPEMNEFASEAMELLTLPLLERERGGFYDAADAARSRTRLLERAGGVLVSASTIDAIQHWIYAQDPHTLTIDAIDAAWTRIAERFDTGVDWTGLERARAKGWHIIHLFQFPFYYLEYAIAYLGALQLWERLDDDPAGALAGYKRALALGGTRPLDELFAAAGIEFRFDRALVGRLADRVAAAMTEDAD